MKKKNKGLSLKYKMLIYLITFAITILSLIYISQVTMLLSSYRTTKVEEINSTISDIENNVKIINDTELFQDYIYYLATNYGVGIRVIYDTSLINSKVLDFKAGMKKDFLVNKNKEEIDRLIELAIINNGNYLHSEKISDDIITNSEFRKATFQNEFISDNIENLVQTKHYDLNNATISILVGVSILPNNATVITLQNQFVLIVIIVLLLTIFLAFLITRKVIAPLEAISKEAMKLGVNSYEKVANNTGYLEVSQLDDILYNASLKINAGERMKRDLLANVSHDLRTPLTMIGGYAEMMRDLPGENNVENATVILDESKRLSLLVNDLLELSKLQDKRIKLVLEEVKLSSLLNDVYKQFDKYTKKAGFSFNLEISQDCIVKCDPKRIKQVLYNFINNAINYSKEDLYVMIKQTIIDENYCLIEVIDHGSGIDETLLSEIWDRYYKIDGLHKRFLTGSGIGLAISKEILECHRFQYGVRSKLNQGSTFYFDLPIVELVVEKKQKSIFDRRKQNYK